jgi:hypothetical protein
MGTVRSVMKVMNCEICVKYLCGNAMSLRSECCDCLFFEYEAEKVEVHEEIENDEIICGSCCSMKHKH